MPDEGFPSINYVPIPQGGNMLEGLMQLYGAYKGIQGQNQQNAYLKANPYKGATNSGALEAALKVAGGQEQDARTTNYGADSTYRNALTNNMPAETNIKQEGADADRDRAAAMGTEAQTGVDRLTMEQDPNSPGNKTRAQEASNTHDYQVGELEDNRKRTDIMGQDHQLAVDQKNEEGKRVMLTNLVDHYMQRSNSGIPLTPKEQAESDQVMDAARKIGGIPTLPQATPGPGDGSKGGLLDMPGAAAAGQPTGEPGSYTVGDQLTGRADPLTDLMNRKGATRGSVTISDPVDTGHYDAQGNPIGGMSQDEKLTHAAQGVYDSIRKQDPEAGGAGFTKDKQGVMFPDDLLAKPIKSAVFQRMQEMGLPVELDKGGHIRYSKKSMSSQVNAVVPQVPYQGY